MRIDGYWSRSDNDGFTRPVMEAEVLDGDGSWKKFELLVDTGADRTVLCAAVLDLLNLPQKGPGDQLGGVGGDAECVIVETAIRMTSDAGEKVILRSDYAAFPHVETLDTSVLGRDILNLFALIVDYGADEICLLADPHNYIVSPGQ